MIDLKALESPRLDESALADSIVAYVTRHGPGVSFVELDRGVPGFHAEEGEPWADFEIPDKNLVLWVNMTLAGYRGLLYAMLTDRIHFKITSPMVYLFDGGIVSAIPLARHWRTYKRERWLPVAFSTGPEFSQCKETLR